MTRAAMNDDSTSSHFRPLPHRICGPVGGQCHLRPGVPVVGCFLLAWSPNITSTAVEKFLDRYAAALLACDAKAIAALYAVPSLILFPNSEDWSLTCFEAFVDSGRSGGRDNRTQGGRHELRGLPLSVRAVLDQPTRVVAGQVVTADSALHRSDSLAFWGLRS